MSRSVKPKKRVRGSLFANYMAMFLSVEIVSLLAFGVILAYFVSNSQKDIQKTALYNYTEKVAESYMTMLDSADSTGAYSDNLCYTLSSMSAAADADMFIVDSTGKVIYCRHMIGSDGGVAEYPVCIHRILKIPLEICIGIITDGMMATEGSLGGLYDENTFISACVVDEDIIFAVQPYENALRPVIYKFVQIYIMAAFVLILVSSLIIYIVTYNITRPLLDISEATKYYAKGDFSYKIKPYSRNTVKEFGELSEAINLMAESLESLEASRSNFVANVSHELKTPMTTIGGFVDGILDGTIERKDQSHYLKIVSGEVKRLSRLVVSMLNMSKIEAGELRIEPVKFNLTEQITGIFISFVQKIEEKDIDVVGLDYLRPTYIEADPDMLSQVFYNLIDNAVKFTNHGGEITVAMENRDNEVVVNIKNTGECINAEDIDHIFERFYKVDKSRSMDAKSAGLGLFIVKNIVGLHNGDISVKTVDDKYTQFTVTLKSKLIGI
ncbi:MAG: HAMP domain-containing histidine kinase [Clostridia bacterium]|nr:HAMP domain-containing histidine kinase [Clostridia bacterium]